MEAKGSGSLKKESGTKCIKHFWDVSCKEDLKVSIGLSEMKSLAGIDADFVGVCTM